MAFSPVISIFEDDILDRRFRSFRKNATHLEYRNLWKDGKLDIEGSMCFDPHHPIDALQARLISKHYKGLVPVAMPLCGHPCTQVVKDALGFTAIQDLVINNEFDPRFPRALHQQSRAVSDLYKTRLERKRKP